MICRNCGADVAEGWACPECGCAPEDGLPTGVPRDPHVASLPAESVEQLVAYCRGAFDGIADVADDVEGAAENGALSIRVSLEALRAMAERILNLRAGVHAAADELSTLRGEVARLQEAILDQGGQWVPDDREDGVRAVTAGISLDPMAEIDRKLALLDGPRPATPGGVAPEDAHLLLPRCAELSPIQRVACERESGHAGWHLCDESHTRGVDARVWWSA